MHRSFIPLRREGSAEPPRPPPDLDKDCGRNEHGKEYSNRHGDRYSSRHDEYSRREKHNYRSKDASPSRAGSGSKYNYATSEDKHRDWQRRDRDVRDEKREHHRSHRNWRDNHNRENNQREVNGQKDTDKDKDRYNSGDKSISGSEIQESVTKRPKLFTSESDVDHRKHANERLKQVEEVDGKVPAQHFHATNSEAAANDLNSAKLAAMKAAELVNINLGGVGIMSTEQKKKLLWGSKKSTSSEVSARQWDTALFDDNERRDKFNKLMGVKGDVKADQKSNTEDGDGRLQAEKQKEVQLDLEKQYTAGLRRRDGRTVGLGL